MLAQTSVPVSVAVPFAVRWAVVYAWGGLGCAAFLVGQILVSVNERIPARNRLLTGIVVICACFLWVRWFKLTKHTF